jgi:hypothetical protein
MEGGQFNAAAVKPQWKNIFVTNLKMCISKNKTYICKLQWNKLNILQINEYIIEKELATRKEKLTGK